MTTERDPADVPEAVKKMAEDLRAKGANVSIHRIDVKAEPEPETKAPNIFDQVDSVMKRHGFDPERRCEVLHSMNVMFEMTEENGMFESLDHLFTEHGCVEAGEAALAILRTTTIAVAKIREFEAVTGCELRITKEGSDDSTAAECLAQMEQAIEMMKAASATARPN